MNMPISNKAAAAPAFVNAMADAASKADNANLSTTCNVLIIIRNSGGTNKKAAGALWSLLPDAVVTTFAQAKRVNGALNAPSDKATNGAKQVRAIWIGAKNQTAFVKGLLDIGVSSPRALLDLVAPRKDKKAPVVKSAVDTFLKTAKADGFSEDVTDLLSWVVETHSKQMQGLLNQADKALKGALKDAAQRQADIEAKQEKAQAAKQAKLEKDAERSRIHAEKMAQLEKDASEAKSAQAKKEYAEKIKRERATHPKVRAVIEA